MKLYEVWTPPAGPPVILREGFSWLVALLGGIGFVRRGAFLTGVSIALGTFLLSRLLDGAPMRLGLIAVIHVTCAVFAPEITGFELARHGYRRSGPIAGVDRDHALSRSLAS